MLAAKSAILNSGIIRFRKATSLRMSTAILINRKQVMDATQINYKKILIVDDERGWRDLLAYELPNHGYGFVTVACDGFEAIEKASQETFDLVLLDIKMPGMDGIEVFITLRKSQPHIKVILMSGHVAEEQIQRKTRSDVTAFIRKPFEIDFMIKSIGQVFA